MNESISYCIRHDILKDVLIKNRSEVRHMLLTEFDEKKFAKSMWKEGHEENFKTGIFHSKMALVRAYCATGTGKRTASSGTRSI